MDDNDFVGMTTQYHNLRSYYQAKNYLVRCRHNTLLPFRSARALIEESLKIDAFFGVDGNEETPFVLAGGRNRPTSLEAAEASFPIAYLCLIANLCRLYFFDFIYIIIFNFARFLFYFCCLELRLKIS